MNPTELTQIVQDKTGKTVTSCTPVFLNNIDLNGLSVQGDVYAGRLSMNVPGAPETALELTFMLNGATTLSTNKTHFVQLPKVYETIFFDQIIGANNINEDTEIMFSGYKFELAT